MNAASYAKLSITNVHFEQIYVNLELNKFMEWIIGKLIQTYFSHTLDPCFASKVKLS